VGRVDALMICLSKKKGYNSYHGLLKEKTVIKRLFMEVVKNQAGEKMA
jgi:hypothetical protein